MISLISAGFTTPVSQWQITFQFLAIFMNSFYFWLSSPNKLSRHNANSSSDNSRHPSQDTGIANSQWGGGQSSCKNSLALNNRLPMEICEDDGIISIWKLLYISNRLNTSSPGGKTSIEDWMTNVEGMIFKMGMYPQLPLSPLVTCVFFLTFISTGAWIYTLH